MNKNDENHVKLIREQLVSQSYEDVYSIHFSGQEMTEELFTRFIDSFDTVNLEISDFNKTKLNLLMTWVGYVQNKGLSFNKFPSFINFYTNHMYKNNGLRNRMSKCCDLVLDKEMEKTDDFISYVEEYETKLLIKSWLTAEDKLLWTDLQRKRKIVEEFEDYIYNLENELNEIWDSNEENFLELYKNVYDEHINGIKIKIAELKLFKGDFNKISIFENLMEYFIQLRDNFSLFNLEGRGQIKQEDPGEIDIQINLEDQEKFVYCSKLGVIDFLKKKIEDSGVKYFDKELYPLIVHITGNSLLSVKKLMSFHNYPNNISGDNPFNDSKLMGRVNKFLINRSLIKPGD